MPQKPTALEQALADRNPPKIVDPKALELMRGVLPEPVMPVPPDFDTTGKMISPGKPTHAAPFRPAPEVVGGSAIARTVDKLTRLFPSLRGGPVKKVTGGPSADTIRSMVESDLPPDKFLETTLDGVTNKTTRNVSLSDDHIGTAIHEFGHGHSALGEVGALTLEEALARATGVPAKPRGNPLQERVFPKANLTFLGALLNEGRR